MNDATILMNGLHLVRTTVATHTNVLLLLITTAMNEGTLNLLTLEAIRIQKKIFNEATVTQKTLTAKDIRTLGLLMDHLMDLTLFSTTRKLKRRGGFALEKKHIVGNTFHVSI